MPLPPIKISDKVQKAAYDDLAKGAMRKFGDVLALIADRVINPHFKSAEECVLDWQTGEQESENRRRLAAEALDRVLPERRIFPAPQIMGPIFRDSEFELPDTPIWEMWSQLLSQACDRDRVGRVHPAYPGIISQLSPAEARLLNDLACAGIDDPMTYYTRQLSDRDTGTLIFPSKRWKNRLDIYVMLNLGIDHLTQLNLVNLFTEPAQHDLELRDPNVVTLKTECRLSPWGRSFMRAVSSPTSKGLV